MDVSQIGRSVLRKEGRAKVTGQALYVDDVTPAGMLHGVTVRSPVARGRIKGITFDPAVPWDEFVVVTAADIPGRNVVKLLVDDQPYLASGVVNHPEEPVVLIAHRDRARADDARRRVTIEIEPLPAVLTIDDSLSRREIIWGADNIFKSYEVAKGDVDAAFAGGAIVVEGEYESGAQEQLYIEPNGMLAVADPKHVVTVWGSMQCPYYIHHALAGLQPAGNDPRRRWRPAAASAGKDFHQSAGHAARAGRPAVSEDDPSRRGLSLDDQAAPGQKRVRSRATALIAMDIDLRSTVGVLHAVARRRAGTIHAADRTVPRAPRRAVATNARRTRSAFSAADIFAPSSTWARSPRRPPAWAFRQRNYHLRRYLAVGQKISEPVDAPPSTALLSGYHDARAAPRRAARSKE